MSDNPTGKGDSFVNIQSFMLSFFELLYKHH